MSTNITGPRRTKPRLREARAVLERMHAYIEQRGFNINIAAEGPSPNDIDKEAERLHELDDADYFSAEFRAERIVLDRELTAMREGRVDDVNMGEVCFIGGARLAVGVDPTEWARSDEGDGPELTIALELLDEAALDLFPEYAVEAREVNQRNEDEPGGIAEAYGFLFVPLRQRSLRARDKAEGLAEKADGLDVVRRALKNVNAALGE